MSEMPSVDFFDRLELELREAASRPTRVRPHPGIGMALVAAAAVGAFALLAALLVGGGNGRPVDIAADPGLSPVGTVLPKGSGTPPRSEASMVVAVGKTSFAGPWQLEVFRYPRPPGPKSREAHMRAGMCLMLYLPSTPGINRPGLGGYCGPGDLGFRKTPGFGRQQTVVPPRHPRAVILFGRAPRQATGIVVADPSGSPLFQADPQPAPEGFKERFGFDASFYALAISTRKRLTGARVNWWDRSGQLGSRGIRLMPPLTPQRR